MNGEELRAITAQGPAVILVDRESMLRLLDENAEHVTRNESLERKNRVLAAFSVGAVSLWLWYVIHGLAQWAGVI